MQIFNKYSALHQARRGNKKRGIKYAQVKESMVKGEWMKPKWVKFDFGGKVKVSEVTEECRVTLLGWILRIEDRTLTGKSPIRGSLWVWAASHLAAGVLAGVGENVEVVSGDLGIGILGIFEFWDFPFEFQVRQKFKSDGKIINQRASENLR